MGNQHRLANVIVASDNVEKSKNVKDTLHAENFSVITVPDLDSLLETSEQTHPDLILIDTDEDNFDYQNAILKLKAKTATFSVPIVLLCEQKTDELYQQAVTLKIDDILLYPLNMDEFLIRTRPLLRLSTMFAELNNRVQLAISKGIAASEEVDPNENDPFQILLINPQDGDKAGIEAALNGNCDIAICTDLYDAEEALSAGLFDAAVVSLTQENFEPVFGLCSRSRNNPRLFNLPFIMLSDEATCTDTMEAYRRGATRMLQRPMSIAKMESALKMLVRRQRLRWNIRNALETTKVSETTDALTNAYTFDFLKDHLSSQIEIAHTWKKHLTCIFLSIPNIPSVEKKWNSDAAQHLLQQVHQWITGLTRVEDLVSRSGDYEFCIALPDTPIEEAQVVMHRIAGILSYTDFAISDVYQPVNVWVEVGIASLEADDTVETLLDRAHKDLS